MPPPTMSSTSPLRQPSALARALRVRMARMSWWLHARAPEGAKRLLDLALLPPALVLLLPLFTAVTLAI